VMLQSFDAPSDKQRNATPQSASSPPAADPPAARQ